MSHPNPAQQSPPIVFDTGSIKRAIKFSIWNAAIQRYLIVIPEKVVEECSYPQSGYPPFDLEPLISAEKIKKVTVSAKEGETLIKALPRGYAGRVDPGELECLAYFFLNTSHLVISSDGIVYKTLARLGHASKGISLETLAKLLGIKTSLPPEATECFMQKCFTEGTMDKISGK